MSDLAERIFNALPALNKKFEFEEIKDQCERAAAAAENVVENEQVRRLQRDGRCPTCGADA